MSIKVNYFSQKKPFVTFYFLNTYRGEARVVNNKSNIPKSADDARNLSSVHLGPDGLCSRQLS